MGWGIVRGAVHIAYALSVWHCLDVGDMHKWRVLFSVLLFILFGFLSSFDACHLKAVCQAQSQCGNTTLFSFFDVGSCNAWWQCDTSAWRESSELLVRSEIDGTACNVWAAFWHIYFISLQWVKQVWINLSSLNWIRKAKDNRAHLSVRTLYFVCSFRNCLNVGERWLQSFKWTEKRERESDRQSGKTKIHLQHLSLTFPNPFLPLFVCHLG